MTMIELKNFEKTFHKVAFITKLKILTYNQYIFKCFNKTIRLKSLQFNLKLKCECRRNNYETSSRHTEMRSSRVQFHGERVGV